MKHDAITVINFVLCGGIGWAAFCRLNAMAKHFKFGERLKYVVMLVGGMVGGLQGPIFGEQPGLADICLASSMLAYLVLGMWRWRHGPPQDALNTLHPE